MSLVLSLCALLLLLLTSAAVTANGYKFYVGGKTGWVLHPDESYSHWAGRNRFQVNDTLYFKYNKLTDSVLLVDKDDYTNCNTTKPLLKLEGGESVFKFDRSGPFFFITGNVTNCQKGQKLIVVVLAVRPPPPSPHVPPNPQPPTPVSPAPSLPPSAAPSPATPPRKSTGTAVSGRSTVLFSAVFVVLSLIGF